MTIKLPAPLQEAIIPQVDKAAVPMEMVPRENKKDEAPMVFKG